MTDKIIGDEGYECREGWWKGKQPKHAFSCNVMLSIGPYKMRSCCVAELQILKKTYKRIVTGLSQPSVGTKAINECLQEKSSLSSLVIGNVPVENERSCIDKLEGTAAQYNYQTIQTSTVSIFCAYNSNMDGKLQKHEGMASKTPVKRD
uniref:Uncharacterized protein n=1 Tax=Tanacetum cinerariifolium TaxID=118510 RepID=A0A6L2P532_TANCI|nr:hypothetical protein [Tanacetum cinerariifolium]